MAISAFPADRILYDDRALPGVTCGPGPAEVVNAGTDHSNASVSSPRNAAALHGGFRSAWRSPSAVTAKNAARSDAAG